MNLHRLLYSTHLWNSKVVFIRKTEPYSGEIQRPSWQFGNVSLQLHPSFSFSHLHHWIKWTHGQAVYMLPQSVRRKSCRYQGWLMGGVYTDDTIQGWKSTNVSITTQRNNVFHSEATEMILCVCRLINHRYSDVAGQMIKSIIFAW